MKIEKLEIRNFGKMQNRTLEFSDGIQLISGENESGKSTVHFFSAVPACRQQRLETIVERLL